jgi:putative PEP-CTERM system histidine kinase
LAGRAWRGAALDPPGRLPLQVFRLHAPWYLNPAVWSFGVTAAAFAAFGVLLSLRWRGELRSALFLSAVMLSALWAVSAAAFAAGATAPMWRTAMAFDVLRLAGLLVFLLLLLRGEADLAGRSSGPALPVTIAVLCAGVLMIGYPPPEVPEPEGGSYLLPFSLMLGLSVVGLAAVEQLFRHTPDSLRWNAWPLCVGLGGVFLYDLVLFTDALLFRVLDEDIWVARGLVQTLVIPLLGLAVARNREWTFDVSISRGAILGSTALIGASAYLLVVAALGYHVRVFGGRWGTTLATALVFIALLFFAFVAASRTFRSKLRVLVAKNFLTYRYDYRDEWLKFTQLLSFPGGGRPLYERCVLALGELVETASGALWLRRDGQLRQVVHVAQPEVADVEPEDGALASFLRSTGWVIDVEEARRASHRYRGLQLPAWLASSTNAWLVVPLPIGEGLVGFVVLGRPRVRFALDWEVLDLLKTAARQTAGHLAQEQATDALLEARKFESFNRMSAFVVHDLKNLVAQLQLMLRNAERHHANPEFQRDMLATVENVVTRMNTLMLQLRAGERPVDRPHAVDLRAVLARVQQVRAAGRGPMRVDCSDGALAMGHADRLERVIGHLVQNAFEAVETAGVARPSVEVRVDRRGDAVAIEVTDNGVGMSADFIRERLFRPFSSTKQSGMGIGTYESQQYVASIGGSIDVESRPQAGTTFRVVLRAADAATAQEVGE